MTTQSGRPWRSQASSIQRPLPTPLTFDDLVADLTWPKLLRAGPLAIRPSRVMLGMVWLVGAAGILWVCDRVDDAPNNVLADGLRQIGLSYASLFRGRSPENYADLHDALLGAPARLVYEHPFVTILGLLALVLWTSVLGGAISRSAASDFALGRPISWPEALGFSLSRWRSLAGSILLPLVLLWIITFSITVGGLLLRVSGLNLLVGVGWGVFLVGGLVAAAIMTTFALGHTMLVPAITCEGTDAIDAVQHAYAYVYAKPLRLVLYSLLLIVQGLIVVAIAWFVMLLTMHTAAWAAQGFAGARGEAIMAEVSRQIPAVPALGRTGSSESLTNTDRYTAGMIAFWCYALFVITLGVAVSVYWTSCTLLYLAMRRICDGQDVHELWAPGMIEGSLAPASTPPLPKPGETVSETGPADET